MYRVSPRCCLLYRVDIQFQEECLQIVPDFVETESPFHHLADRFPFCPALNRHPIGGAQEACPVGAMHAMDKVGSAVLVGD